MVSLYFSGNLTDHQLENSHLLIHLFLRVLTLKLKHAFEKAILFCNQL